MIGLLQGERCTGKTSLMLLLLIFQEINPSITMSPYIVSGGQHRLASLGYSSQIGQRAAFRGNTKLTGVPSLGSPEFNGD